jgi:hypothetical protein
MSQNCWRRCNCTRSVDEFMEPEEFESLARAQALAELWKEEYYTERSHGSLKYRTPTKLATICRSYVPTEENSLDPPSTEHTYG